MAGFYYAGQAYPGRSGILAEDAVVIPHIPSTTVLYPPTVTQEQVIELPFIASTTVLYPPSIQADQTLELPFIDSTTVLYPPTVEQTVELPYIASETVLYPPTVKQNIVLPFIDSTTTLYPPTVAQEQIIELPLIASTTTLYPPTISNDQTLELPFIPSESILYPPTLTQPSRPVDLTKLIFHSSYPAFINSTVYSGSFNISGTANSGTNQRTHTVTLDRAPDLIDIMFEGDSNALDLFGRPDDTWFRSGAVWVDGDAGFGAIPLPWVITYEIDGSDVIIKATYVQTFTASTTLTTTTVNYRIVDYSVF